MSLVLGVRTLMVTKIFYLSFFISLCSASVAYNTEQEESLTLPELHRRTITGTIVAQDGSGKYTSIQKAIDAVPEHRREGQRFVIHIKAGTYNETVRVGRHLHDLTLVGDGIGRTIITSNIVSRRSLDKKSATLQVDAHGFWAQGITFRNTAGLRKRAAALHSSSDKAVFYQCSFEGYRNTLIVHSMRQFFRECTIYGSSDIISGSAAAVFQKCTIFVRKGLTRQNAITLHGRQNLVERTGFSILDSTVLPAPDLAPLVHQYKTYLGEPARKYSRTVFAKTNLDGFIDPKGWYSRRDFRKTVYYGEYKNYGAGARTDGRVKWPGYHVMSKVEASQFTVEGLLQGQSWLPATKVPFDLGL